MFALIKFIIQKTLLITLITKKPNKLLYSFNWLDNTVKISTETNQRISEKMTTAIIKTTPDTEIATTRIFNASQELVYKAWTNPAHLQKWWGPNGFTNTFNEFDFRVGGKWSFIMHGPDKGNYPNECEFIKIEKPSLVAWKRHSKPHFQVLATFHKVSDNETKVIFKMLFNSPEECSKLKPFVVDKNEENFDRLEVELNKMKL